MDERMVLSPDEIRIILIGSIVSVNITHGEPLSRSLMDELARNAAMALCCGRKMQLVEED